MQQTYSSNRLKPRRRLIVFDCGMNSRWHSLVAETQFATELALSGLHRLCTVPAHVDPDRWVGDDQNYVFHVGMYSYASGLERLGKLAIACDGFGDAGEFPSVRRFNHRIKDLLDAVESLGMDERGGALLDAAYLSRPLDDLDPELTDAVEQFAAGAARYEHLDSLASPNVEVGAYRQWVRLGAKTSISDDISRLMSLRSVVSHVLTSELVEDGLETCAEPFLDEVDQPMFAPSVGLSLSLFRKVRWVSAVLSEATYYKSEQLPILNEVVGRYFLCSSTEFFKYHIARIPDEEVVTEELEEVMPRVEQRERDDDDSWP